MMASLYTAVSGLKGQQTALDVISNNISNVNTTGYKSQSVSFSDLLSQTLSSASGSSSTSGGTNAKQIGTGVSVAATNTNTTVGSTETTGVETDVSIGGDGYLVVQGSSGSYLYTRNGELSVDDDGNLNINGYEVCGWLSTTDASGNTTVTTNNTPVKINVYSDTSMPAKTTTAISLNSASTSGNYLDSGDTAATTATALTSIGTTPTEFDKTATVKVYDSQGNDYTATLNFKKCYVDATTNTTSWYYEVSGDSATISPSSGYIAFDSDGNLVSGTVGTDTFTTSSSLTITPTDGSTAAFSATLDFSGLTSTNASTTSSSDASSLSFTQDGYAAGTMESWSVSTDGSIVVSYSNDQKKTIAQLALATFSNASGLEKTGSSLYSSSNNSGDPVYTTAGSGGTGSLSSGTLEMSNVSLASEFTNLMIAQRAYQANTKVISTADEMLQSLINMKS
ncbi:flagellar hook-basal body complex protein [Azotosporobacter soli]|uniref:flagellar hook protein FlgE n=1 Tax=Azotosporobacter soli TaxID=3055040 RepID=UPI0031FEB492